MAALTRGAESDPSLAFGRGRDGTTMVPDKPGIHDLKLFCFLCPRQDSHDRCHASHIYEGYFFPQVVGNGSFKCLQFKTLVLLPFTLYSFEIYCLVYLLSDIVSLAFWLFGLITCQVAY